jgi:hypothetical protein
MTEAGAEMRLLLSAIKFSSEHPYAATAVVGAAAGSLVTWAIMSTQQELREQKVVRGKVFEVEVPSENLQDLIDDPTIELRFDQPLITVIVTGEKREPLKALPDIVVEQ